MSHHVFTDPAGPPWQAWAVHPGVHTGVRSLAPKDQGGRLALERIGEPAERRRAAPVPAAGEDAPVGEMRDLVAAAQPVERRARPGRH